MIIILHNKNGIGNDKNSNFPFNPLDTLEIFGILFKPAMKYIRSNKNDPITLLSIVLYNII
tara:strand:+ start:290 stop:472 length:183 start_codon:yes stop_codon:yes gene_type:complete